MNYILVLFLHFSLFCYQVSSSALPNTEKRFRRGAETIKAGHDWGYSEDNGPETWCSHYPACCGLKQSPINIIGDNTTHVDYLPIIFKDYDLPRDVLMTNNGHTVSITLKNNYPVPTLTGGHLPGIYHLSSIHYHWGRNDEEGSEHLVDSESFPLEAHFVHFNNKYANIGNAQTFQDGLAVLGVLYALSPKDNDALQPIVKELQNIEFVDQSCDVKSKIVIMDLLLPLEDTSQFYRYNGSLTTPPCAEVVTWTVFDKTSTVSKAQLKEFRGDLHTEHECEDDDEVISENHRDPQDGHDILVEHNVDRLAAVYKDFPKELRATRTRSRHHG